MKTLIFQATVKFTYFRIFFVNFDTTYKLQLRVRALVCQNLDLGLKIDK